VAGTDDGDGISVQTMARMTFDKLADRSPSYIRLPLGWPGDCARFADPMDYLGFDGGGGIGSGPGMAVGAALGLKGSGRLPVAILGDGDYLMGLTALWTGVSHQVPLLIVIANNQSFFNDELHQERVARQRGRPVENRSIGLRMSAPAMNLAELARGQGAQGIGPVTKVDDLGAALDEAIAAVAAGGLAVVDVHVFPEYARAMSAALLRTIPERNG
jgi:thiamine pyrophosphate-dependent acetolactate synthase large subunit-like protein